MAAIPTKDVLIARFMGSLRSSLYGFTYALQAIIDKNGEGQPTAEDATAEAPAEA